MRPGWNPTRRNRNVGTKAHGHGEDNRLVIPESRHDDKWFPERLGTPVAIRRRVGEHEMRFLVEPPRPGWFYPCTVDDACRVLAALPAPDLATFDMVVMRQSTRKQRALNPAWGLAIFSFDVFGHDGTAIVIEAQNLEPLAWEFSLTPERARELDRLRGDGHDVRRGRRRFEIQVSPKSLRNTVLYRTLLHEVGHHVDRRRHSTTQWDAIPSTQKEDFAHRHASSALGRLRSLGVVPFAPLFDIDDLQRCGLKPEWFKPRSSTSTA
jgi:hypothetical protein